MKKIERVKEEFRQWRETYDNILDITNCKPEKFKKKLKEELYVFKEDKELKVSGGLLIWLFLGGNNQYPYIPKKNEKPNKILEELKIRHRLDLFKINTEDFDYNKVLEVLR